MRLNRGDHVRYFFDTGAFGYTYLYGEVIQAGPKMATVLWESGIRNRVQQDNNDIEMDMRRADD